MNENPLRVTPLTRLAVNSLLPAVLATGGVLLLAAPNVLSRRLGSTDGQFGNDLFFIYALALSFIALAGAIKWDSYQNRIATNLFLLVSLTVFVLFSMGLSNWLIDDAGITFAYSRSLADGYGLVFQPGQPAEEGYSSTVWMLVLSLAHALGLDIPVTAKWLGIGFAAATLALFLDLMRREARSLVVSFLGLCAVCTAPYVVWAASGQEHSLQALLLFLAAYLIVRVRAWHWPVAIVLTVLVFTRPEAPIIVVAVFSAALWLSWHSTGRLEVLRNLPIALLPFLGFVALHTFRLIYFNDLFPNPYYAKAADAHALPLFNPFGQGWQYVLRGLRDTGLLLILPLAVFLPRQPNKVITLFAYAVISAQVFFVVWAGGDWMGQYRFLMPILPLLALPLVTKAAAFAPTQRQLVCSLFALFFLQSTVMQLYAFKAQPTTPFQVVSEIGKTFHRLAETLQIEDAVLAHHDAGAISYDREIELIDLGGLVNRTIAKNIANRTFLETYLLDERKPDFVFGARILASESGFTDSDKFSRLYARLEFADQPIMRSDLSFIRRDRIVEERGIEVSRAPTGEVVSVTVLDEPR
jgi:hypothetical protein